MFSNSRLDYLIVMTLLCAAAASAQQSSQQSQPDSGKLYLNVTASPKSGPPVANLQQQDFTVLVNNSPQAITSFKSVTGREAPIEIVVVIDAINTDARNIAYERIQIDKFLRAEGGHLAYPVAIAVATDTGVQVAENFASDGNALSSAMDRDQIGLRDIGRSAGFYGATERLQYSLQALNQLSANEAPHQGRKILLWVSPGWHSAYRPQCRTRLEAAVRDLRGHCQILHPAPPEPRHPLQRQSYWRRRVSVFWHVLPGVPERRQQTEPGQSGESRTSSPGHSEWRASL